jgi:hypothetical protein
VAIITTDKVLELLESSNYLVKVKWRKGGCRVIFPTRIISPRKLTYELLMEQKGDELKVSRKGYPVRKFEGPSYAMRIAMGVFITEGCTELTYDLSMIKFYNRKNEPVTGLKKVVYMSKEDIVNESKIEDILATGQDAIEKRALAETLNVLDGFDFLVQLSNSGGSDE